MLETELRDEVPRISPINSDGAAPRERGRVELEREGLPLCEDGLVATTLGVSNIECL